MLERDGKISINALAMVVISSSGNSLSNGRSPG
jgi:hypothetical protein